MRRKVDLVILLVVLVVGIFAVKNAQTLGDIWHSQVYDPPAEIAKLADDAGMSDEGKKLFFRFSPQLVDQQTLDEKCSIEKLGCAEGQSLYILEYKTAAEYNRAIVTAAHEMLHVAYSRLTADELYKLEGLLKAELSGYEAAEVVSKLQDYPKEDYDNEAHSFVGSELETVGSELEQHYKRYFIDRSKSVAAFRASPER